MDKLVLWFTMEMEIASFDPTSLLGEGLDLGSSYIGPCDGVLEAKLVDPLRTRVYII